MKRAAPPLFLLIIVSLLVLLTADARLQPFDSSSEVLPFARFAQDRQAPNPADRFEVSDVMIPMRDGKKLHTKIFTPRLRQGSGAAGYNGEPLPITPGALAAKR